MKQSLVTWVAIAALLSGVQAVAQQAPSVTPPAAPRKPDYGNAIDLARAQAVMAAAEQEARRQQVPYTFAICDSSGHLVLFERMDSVDRGDGDIVIALARSAVEFRMSTKELAEFAAKGPPGSALLPGLVAFPGGWPLIVDGKLIGAIGMAGHPVAAAAITAAALKALK
jgi:uncharacterized protein GlcG (DUF336 family)